MDNQKRRLTIGVLVSGITDEFTKLICRGAMQMAKQMDVNIVALPGKYIDRDVSDKPDLMYEYQFNTIFSYAKKENVDAIIVAAGSIGCFASRENIAQMMKMFDGIPCVLVSYKMDEYINILFDNYTGIKEGIDYLIDRTGCRKIGMIGGRLDNTDAAERKKAFEGILASHGIEFSDRAYVSGNYSKDSIGVARTLLDNNPDLDAIFCVNDDTAFGLYEELNRRGIQIGKDIHVLGYDDVVMAAKMNPSLSSVRADGTVLGEEALKMAIRLVHGEDVENKVLPTKFVKRDSIGNGYQEKDEQRSKFLEESIETYFDDIFYRCRHEKLKEKMQTLKASFQKLINTLILVYDKGDDSPENFMEIQMALGNFLNEGAIEHADVSNLLNCFEGIYRTLKNTLPDRDARFKLQDTFSAIYRRIIRATDVYIGRMSANQEKENYSIKMFVRDVLQFEKGNDLSYTSLLGNLEWLGIRNAYVYIFRDPIMHLVREQFVPPKYLYLKAVLKDGVVSSVPSLRQKVFLKDLFDNDFIEKDIKYTYVCLPLFSSEMIYGVLLCDLTEEIFVNGEFLINQMSSAAKMITLLKANEQIQQKLEESLAVLKENNLALDTLSKSDGLTGILNRRGFYTEAEKLIEENRKSGGNLLAIYVDMNNLKIINDRYGHEEGDFALKLISDILSDEIKDVGIAGRIGGDEYACIMKYQPADDGEGILNKIYNRFTTFNESSDKPYNVTVSAGASLIGAKDDITLKEALTQADEKLYEVKKFRKKDVAKK
ncbi:MAG: GGDEF domain-containing protein [Lachnospiraceae bacterium]|nr:GGDEF domain-containing protein [Lachnospiraceae bacterium]